MWKLGWRHEPSCDAHEQKRCAQGDASENEAFVVHILLSLLL